jgi:ribosomal protein L3
LIKTWTSTIPVQTLKAPTQSKISCKSLSLSKWRLSLLSAGFKKMSVVVRADSACSKSLQQHNAKIYSDEIKRKVKEGKINDPNAAEKEAITAELFSGASKVFLPVNRSNKCARRR